MRILHTADWHLGHTLRDHSREAEHQAFLQWLVATVVERRVDALLVCGDVFDSANPPPAAWRMWFQFLGDLKRAAPAVQVVVIAGNHDSAARLEAPRDLLAAFDVRVIGTVRRDAAGQAVAEDLLVPLRAADGSEALVVAIPFLRASDVLAFTPRGAPPPADDDRLPRPGEPATAAAGDDSLLQGMRVLHDALFAAARAVRRPAQALVAMAHGYLVGGALSELSERKVLGGNQHALPIDLFPAECAYVALGHLHRPQTLAGLEQVRYSGSPLPLAMPEREHPHHVVFADFAGPQLAKVWSLRVPRRVAMLRLPEHDALEPAAALAAVAALPDRDQARDNGLRPLLEIAVRVPAPMPQLAEQLAARCASKDVRLVRVEMVSTGSGLVDDAPGVELRSLQPEQVFLRRWRKDHAGEVPTALLTAFRDLLEDVEHGGGA